MSLITDMHIIDDMMEQIVSKKLSPGSKLPSENELVDHYRVPRMTVRTALMKLEERGIVYSIHGKGRYLREKSKQIQLQLSGKTSFTEKMEQLGYQLTTKTMSCKEIAYNQEIFEILQAEKSDRVFEIARLRRIDGEPIAIHSSYVKKSSFPLIEEEGQQITSMFAYYREKGFHDFTSSQTILSINFPTLKEQQIFQCKSLVPLIILESDCIDAKTDQILEYTKILYRSDKFKYDIPTN